MTLHNSDEVAAKIKASPSADPEAFIGWSQHCIERNELLSKAKSCAISNWIAVTTMAVLSTLITWYFQISTHEAIDSLSPNNASSITFHEFAPLALFALSCVLCIALPLAWFLNYVPGFRGLRTAIDWTTTGNAMGRLLSLGCPYPTAFRITASSLQCRAQRHWIKDAAVRVEAGRPAIPEDISCTSETAVLVTILSRADSIAQQDWRVVSEHYDASAKRKLSVLLAATPVASILIAGGILLFSISTTLGTFWGSLSSLVFQLY